MAVEGVVSQRKARVDDDTPDKPSAHPPAPPPLPPPVPPPPPPRTGGDGTNLGRRQLLVGVFQVVFVLVLGTFTISLVEEWTIIDSVYFCSVVLFTIGYGDVSPRTSAGKVITILYCIAGISFVANLVSLLGSQNILLMNALSAHIKKVMQKRQMLGSRGIWFRIDISVAMDIFIALFATLVYLFVGMAFFCPIEKMTAFEGFFYSAITLSTVGYGDLSPKSPAGRLVFVGYAFLGIGVITFTVTLLGSSVTRLIRNKLWRVLARRRLGRTAGDGSMIDEAPVLFDMWISAALSACMAVIGIVAFRYLESWSTLDAAYFTVVTMATIGFGDLVPQTTTGRSFCILFIFLSLSTLSALLRSISALSQLRLSVGIKRLETARLQRYLAGPSARDPITGADEELMIMLRDLRAFNSLRDATGNEDELTSSVSSAPLGAAAPNTVQGEWLKAFTLAREDVLRRVKLLSSRSNFTDSDMPPSYRSLTGITSLSRAPVDPDTGELIPAFRRGHSWVRARKIGPLFAENAPGGQCIARSTDVCAPRSDPLLGTRHQYLLNALSVLSVLGAGHVPNIVTDASDVGLFAVLLCTGGRWRHVIVDDFLPLSPLGVLEASGTERALWVAVMEKAFAKRWGGYHKLDESASNPRLNLTEVFAELTGAVPLEIDLSGSSLEQLADTLQRSSAGHMVCLTSRRGRAHQRSKRGGVLQDTAYCVLAVRGGEGGDGEVHLAAHSSWPHSILKDGWMPIAKVPRFFTTAHVWRFFGPDLHCARAHGEWKGASAGGSPTQGFTVANNPQFFLNVRRACRVHISLTQDSVPTPHPITLTVANKRGRRLKNVFRNERIVSSEPVAQGTILVTCTLVPLVKGRSYTVVPSTESAGQEGKFFLQVFATAEVTLVAAEPEVPAD